MTQRADHPQPGAAEDAEVHHLDTKGLKCPLPVLRARKAMKSVPLGGVLVVEATDPGAVRDFQAFCETLGAELEESREEDGVFHFRIRRPAA